MAGSTSEIAFQQLSRLSRHHAKTEQPDDGYNRCKKEERAAYNEYPDGQFRVRLLSRICIRRPFTLTNRDRMPGGRSAGSYGLGSVGFNTEPWSALAAARGKSVCRRRAAELCKTWRRVTEYLGKDSESRLMSSPLCRFCIFIRIRWEAEL